MPLHGTNSATGIDMQDELDASTTHAIVESAQPAAYKGLPSIKLVSPAWLQNTLAAGSIQPEAEYTYDASDAASPSPSSECEAPTLQRWLGHWSCEFNHEPPGHLHLMLQVKAHTGVQA